MAVNALELRPRGGIALFDASLRLCARSSGVWSLVLPSGAALVAASFHLAEAISRHRPLLWPSLLFTLAWLFRGLCQGASADFLERQLLEPQEPSASSAFLAALKRAPALVWASGYCFFLNACIYLFSGGLGFLLLPAHLVAYAVMMKGRGGLWGLYGTCARMLGPARHTAASIRLCGASQLLVIFNLHLSTALGLMAARKLLALEVTFLERFCSFDNPVWLAAITALGFSLFEPLRAASAALLLVDGRVRQEGLDLLAQLEQLPLRRKPKASPAAAVAVLVLACLYPSTSRAADDWSGTWSPGLPVAGEASTAMSQRLRDVVDECDLGEKVTPQQLEAADRQSAVAPAAMTRFVARVERLAWDDENCEAAEAELTLGLSQMTQADQQAARSSASARDQAAAILSRPEFQVDPPVVDKPKDDAEPEAPGWFKKWWDELWESIWRWLRKNRSSDRSSSQVDVSMGPAMGLSQVVVALAIALVLALLAYLLFKARGPQDGPQLDTEQGGPVEAALVPDPMNALSRPPDGWAGLADQLAREGRFREAIRHLYLALLSRLHRDGAIDYDPAKSNWDYFRGFKGRLEALQPFRELTRRFDFAWYGNLEVSDGSYQTFRSLTQPLLHARAEESSSGA